MHQFGANPMSDEERLGLLAMQFRGTRDDSGRRKIAQEYSWAMDRLVKSGRWSEMPAPEDQLPDDSMPPEFFDNWMGWTARP